MILKFIVIIFPFSFLKMAIFPQKNVFSFFVFTFIQYKAIQYLLFQFIILDKPNDNWAINEVIIKIIFEY